MCPANNSAPVCCKDALKCRGLDPALGGGRGGVSYYNSTIAVTSHYRLVQLGNRACTCTGTLRTEILPTFACCPTLMCLVPLGSQVDYPDPWSGPHAAKGSAAYTGHAWTPAAGPTALAKGDPRVRARLVATCTTTAHALSLSCEARGHQNPIPYAPLLTLGHPQLPPGTPATFISQLGGQIYNSFLLACVNSARWP